MKTIFAAALALLLAAMPAHAQMVWPPEPAPFARGACDMPQAGGTGTTPKVVTSVDGFEGYYYHCPKESVYAPRFVVLVRSTSHSIKHPPVSEWFALSRDALVARLWRDNPGVDCRRLADGSEFAPICAATIAAAEADPARPVVKWAVSGSGTLTTRATYVADLSDDNALTWVQLTAPRAAVGEPCACDVGAAKAGTQTRCPLASGATVTRTATVSHDGTPAKVTQRLRVWAQCTRQ